MVLKFYTYISLFISFISYSQEHINVEYKVSPNNFLIESQLSSVKDKIVQDSSILKEEGIKFEAFETFKKSFQLLDQMVMYLKATKKESYYWGENRLSSDYDVLAYKTAEIMIDGKSKFYTSLDENLVLKWKNIFGENFIIEINLNENNWKLTKEAKLIGNYRCLKAISTYVISNSKGNFTKQVTAWYCPEIPYNFGPKNYSGLPGLILELIDDKIIYTANNISFKSDEVEINQLPKGKHITQEKLDAIAEKLMEERKQESIQRN